MALGKLESHIQKNETRPLSYTIHKMNQNELDLNTRPETIKNTQKNTDSTLFDAGLSNIFFGSGYSGKGTNAKINKWDYVKLKGFCTAKETINKMKRQPTNRRKKNANHISNKGLISKTYKELIQQQKANNMI